MAGFVSGVLPDLIEPQFVDASQKKHSIRIFEVVPDDPKLSSLNVRLQSRVHLTPDTRIFFTLRNLTSFCIDPLD